MVTSAGFPTTCPGDIPKHPGGSGVDVLALSRYYRLNVGRQLRGDGAICNWTQGGVQCVRISYYLKSMSHWDRPKPPFLQPFPHQFPVSIRLQGQGSSSSQRGSIRRSDFIRISSLTVDRSAHLLPPLPTAFLRAGENALPGPYRRADSVESRSAPSPACDLSLSVYPEVDQGDTPLGAGNPCGSSLSQGRQAAIAARAAPRKPSHLVP